MPRRTRPFLQVAAALGLFAAGAWFATGLSTRFSGAPRPLYYVDPMHPAYRSDRPGIAPDCGMQLEPVYAAPAAAEESPAPGTVQVTARKQQLIGVTVGVVERRAPARTVRTVGRVAPDENRIYRLTLGTEGWVRSLRGGNTGTLVRKEETLAVVNSRELATAVRTYVQLRNGLERLAVAGAKPEELDPARLNVDTAANNLMALGMTPAQVKELERTRLAQADVELRSPVTGFVLARTVYPYFRFERATELYQIADLRRVWVLADLFGDEAGWFPRGSAASVSIQGRSARPFVGRVRDLLPQVDPASRALKVRLEVENRGFELRPDMVVDVEFAAPLAPRLLVPIEAVLDSGLRKVVFVERSRGSFEPRRVETGGRFGDDLEVISGLGEGERIVLSGNFLLDSESRMRAAAAGVRGAAVPCAVCGMPLDEERTRASGRRAERQGRTYYFCSADCEEEFGAHPESYAPSSGRPRGETKPDAPMAADPPPVAEGRHPKAAPMPKARPVAQAPEPTRPEAAAAPAPAPAEVADDPRLERAPEAAEAPPLPDPAAERRERRE